MLQSFLYLFYNPLLASLIFATIAQKREKRELDRENDKDFKTSKFKKNSTTATRENKLGYLFLSIWAIGFVIFTLYPIIYSAMMVTSNITYDVTKNGYGKIIDFNFKTGLTFPNYTIRLQNLNNLS